jgi:curli production assembly/transport component CsgG
MRVSLCRWLTAVAVLALVSGCSTSDFDQVGATPEIMPDLATTARLRQLPEPKQQMTVAVYGFEDRTGQRKPDERVAALSTAVTQGGAAILTDAAYQAGQGAWFKVLERKGLSDLLQERKIIRSTRDQYGNGTPLNPLTFAGILLEGGIISYDTNKLTGGFGARILGIGGNTEYRADVVSVYLRAVSVKTGEVVESVKVSKTLFSTKLQANVFKFVAPEEILELDAGITANEPTQVAVRQAIESAMYSLVCEGAMNGLWRFADKAAGETTLETYRKLRTDHAEVAAGGAAAAERAGRARDTAAAAAGPSSHAAAFR